MKFLFTIIIILIVSVGYSNHDVYSFRTYGNLNVKIEHSIYERNTDMAFKCAQFCSYLTNKLITQQNIYLEIYTLQTKEKEDFFVSYGNGLIKTYDNFLTNDKKGNKIPIRELRKTDSIDSEKLIIRYVCGNPDYKKLNRFVFHCINKIDFIKKHQTEIEFKRFASDWIFNSIDPIESKKWAGDLENENAIKEIIADKVFYSEICKFHKEFKFSYKETNSNVIIFQKNSINPISYEFDSLAWFDIKQEFGMFIISDSSFIIADSNNLKISKSLIIPSRFSEYRSVYISRLSKYALEITITNPFNETNQEWFSYIYKPIECELIDIKNLNKKQVKELIKKK